MKKKYIAPKMTIIEMESEQLLAGSGSDNINIDGGDYDGPLGAPDRDSHSIWD